MARASDLDRRGFLAAAAGAAAWLARPGRAPAEGAPPAALPLLETSRFVYVSPLLASGEESACHGEVWFGWLDGAVLVNTRRGTWKVRALRDRQLDRARIWVGDHGAWKTGLTGSGRNEAFRAAPCFDAKARFETDRAVLDRLLALYETKYGSEFERWSEDMRTGFYAGERMLIHYQPV
ncbi:MAG: hypothetical protein OZ948_08190 [Deltaproteobacteria bacterium]|nr:hypothetical protein [Deltaproteobacteria bacterium]